MSNQAHPRHPHARVRAGILVTLLALSPKAPSQDVWKAFDDPGWHAHSLSTLIGGIPGATAPSLGADAAGRSLDQGVNLQLVRQ